MNFTSKLFIAFITTAFLFSSCGDDQEPTITIDNPNIYNFERDGQSTVSFSGQTTRILMGNELIEAMKDFSITEGELIEMFRNQTTNGGDANPFSDASLNESSKSIKSKVAASKDFFSSNTSESARIKRDFESWISAQISEVFPNENQLASPGNPGQIADGSNARYINGKGLEYDQMLGKSLIGALMVDQLSNNYLSAAVLDEGTNKTDNDNSVIVEGNAYTTMEHKWDEAFGYLFGVSTDLKDPVPTIGEDKFLNKYVGRVDGDSDFAGIADDIFQAFKLGRAAIVASDYTLRDQQAEIIRGLIAKVIGVRAVYYLQQGKNGLPIIGNDYGPSFHDFSEGLGFIYSLRFVRTAYSNTSLFTREEVDGFIDQLLAGNGFWDVTPETLDSISNAIADKFDFTVEQAGS